MFHQGGHLSKSCAFPHLAHAGLLLRHLATRICSGHNQKQSALNWNCSLMVSRCGTMQRYHSVLVIMGWEAKCNEMIVKMGSVESIHALSIFRNLSAGELGLTEKTKTCQSSLLIETFVWNCFFAQWKRLDKSSLMSPSPWTITSHSKVCPVDVASPTKKFQKQQI